MDFSKLIIFQAATAPDRPALAFTGGVATYGILAGAVAAASQKLRGLGLSPGSLVGISVRNPFHHTALLIASALQGVATVSVQNVFALSAAGLSEDVLLVDEFADVPPTRRTAPVDAGWFDHDPKRGADMQALLAAPGMPRESQVVRIALSSGTTGRPKAVAITAGVLARRFANASFAFGGGSMAGARVMSLMGFSTLPAFMSTFGTLSGGGVICHAPGPRDALQIMRLFQVGVLALTPHQLQSVLDALGPSSAPESLQMVVVGGSRTPRGLLREARSRLCGNILLGYGTTEAGQIAHSHAAAVEESETCAGRLLPWVTLEAVDAAGNVLPAGLEGRLRVRSNEMASYAHGSLANLEHLGDDWFYPGDVGAVDGEGLVFVTGRSAELINRGGTIIAPDLVDEVLKAGGLVLDAAAFGKVNAQGIEEIWAAVVPAEGYDMNELLRRCRAKLADKTPDRIVTVGAIPRNEMGKVLRAELAAATPDSSA